jgi:hypothetical protein
MATQSLAEKLVFATQGGESLLPPECALLVLTSTLATPVAFVLNHFLHQTLKAPNNERVVFLSFLNNFETVAAGVKKLVCSSFTN